MKRFFEILGLTSEALKKIYKSYSYQNFIFCQFYILLKEILNLTEDKSLKKPNQLFNKIKLLRESSLEICETSQIFVLSPECLKNGY